MVIKWCLCRRCIATQLQVLWDPLLPHKSLDEIPLLQASCQLLFFTVVKCSKFQHWKLPYRSVHKIILLLYIVLYKSVCSRPWLIFPLECLPSKFLKHFLLFNWVFGITWLLTSLVQYLKTLANSELLTEMEYNFCNISSIGLPISSNRSKVPVWVSSFQGSTNHAKK